MIPVSSLADVQIKWLKVKERGYSLHGFLVYSAGDSFFPEYIADEGLTDLDQWSGDSCGIFLLHEPPRDWVEYTRQTGHVWWEAYGREAYAPLVGEKFIHVSGHRKLSPDELLSHTPNKGLAKQQVAAVLDHFDLPPTSHPCLVLFRDLHDWNVWVVSLEDLLNLEIPELRSNLRNWFAGRDFKQLLEE